MAPTHDLVKLVLCDTYHQICANNAAAHPTTAQKREATEHLALGDVTPSAERQSNSLSELLVVGHPRVLHAKSFNELARIIVKPLSSDLAIHNLYPIGK